jgi:hypothetical protein
MVYGAKPLSMPILLVIGYPPHEIHSYWICGSMDKITIVNSEEEDGWRTSAI